MVLIILLVGLTFGLLTDIGISVWQRYHPVRGNVLAQWSGKRPRPLMVSGWTLSVALTVFLLYLYRMQIEGTSFAGVAVIGLVGGFALRRLLHSSVFYRLTDDGYLQAEGETVMYLRDKSAGLRGNHIVLDAGRGVTRAIAFPSDANTRNVLLQALRLAVND